MYKLQNLINVSRENFGSRHGRMRNTDIFKGVLTVLLLIAMIALSSPFPVQAEDNITQEVKDLIKDYYVDVPSAKVLQANTVDQVLSALDDPYTQYFTAQEYQEFISSLDPQFCGVGVYIDIMAEGARVVSVIRDSPAEAAGLKSGDIIIKAGDKNLAGLADEEVTTALRGPAGSIVRLTVKRGSSSFSIGITRREIEVPTVTGEIITGHTGYIDIAAFGSDTGTEFGKVLNDLQQQGVDNWVIDLRDNPGGYLTSACQVAGYFIGDKTVIKTKDRTEWTEVPAIKHDLLIDQPVVLLINQNSASASEIVAAAIKDYNRGVLMGITTYGKGTIQQLFALSNGDILKMTVARFYSPNQHEINHAGVTPDIVMGEK